MNVTPSAIYVTESQHVTNVLGVEILAMQETIRQQQSTIDRLTEQLKASQRELINWDDSLRISAELLGDSKPTRLPIQKIINMNKALIAEIEAGK